MDCVRTRDDHEVIHQGSIGANRLGPYACASRDEVLFLDLGYQALQTAYESFLAKRAVDFSQSRSGMFRSETPEPAVGHGVQAISQIE